MPVTASLGNMSYEVESIYEYIKLKVAAAIFVDAYSLAEEAGSVKTINVVLLGVATATGHLPLSRETIERVIAENVPKRYMDLNSKAFKLGFESQNK